MTTDWGCQNIGHHELIAGILAHKDHGSFETGSLREILAEEPGNLLSRRQWVDFEPADRVDLYTILIKDPNRKGDGLRTFVGNCKCAAAACADDGAGGQPRLRPHGGRHCGGRRGAAPAGNRRDRRPGDLDDPDPGRVAGSVRILQR